MRDVRERIAAGHAAAWRLQAEVLQPTGRVGEYDGLLLPVTGLPEESLNPGLAVHEPDDAADAVHWAEAWRAEHGIIGHGFALPVGRFPRLERALHDRGYEELMRRPMMALELPACFGDLGATRAVSSLADLAAYNAIQVEVYGFPPAIADAYAPPAMLSEPACLPYLAESGGRPVACATGVLSAAAVGVFGVATLSSHRRRGFGRAVTGAVVAAGAAAGADLAWLQSSPEGLSVYRAMGFREVEDWMVLRKP
ncbi:MAG: GNAT family N-acetyltransferase [Mycobacteriales bacterium]|nr:GNAT family N-acetyltransferase [Frankia sp.]